MKKLSKTNLTFVIICVSVVFFIATLFLYHKLGFVPIKHKMSPSELVNVLGRAGRFDIKGSFPSPEQIDTGLKELDTYNYCKKDSDCVAIMGPQYCVFINKSEVKGWKSTGFSDVGTYCSNSQMGGVLGCGAHDKCGVSRPASPNINIDLGGGGTPEHPSIISIADFTKDDILMGASHNVFVARVLSQSGEKALGASPETQFQVEIIDNIKGDLKGTVTVNQFGGYQNGTLVTVEEENDGTNEPYLLEPGQTYLLATRYLESENWYTVLSSSYGKKLLSKDANANMTDLKTLAQNDERVQALTAAYPNEKLLDADIQHNNTRNNYKDYEVKLKAKQASAAQANTPPETAPNATDTTPVTPVN